MAFDPFPGHLMTRLGLVEALPQLGILDGLLGGGFPAVPLPAMQPAGHAVLHVGGIGHDGDLGRARQAFERVDRGQKFHPVVCRGGFAAGQFAFLDDLLAVFGL